MASQDTITIKDLAQLSKAVREPNITPLEWKRTIKEFAAKHNLTDRKAIDLAQIAKEHF